MFLAIKNNDLPMVQLLLSKGAKTDCKVNGITPIILAVLQINTNDNASNVSIIRLLASKGFLDATSSEIKNRTALMLAARYRNVEILEILLNNKALINLKDDDGATALAFAIVYNKTENATYLKNHGGKI